MNPIVLGPAWGRACAWHEGYFIPQEHEVTGMLQEQNTLIVEVACAG